MRYQVVVYGSVFFESDDELIASEYARLTQARWKNVTIRKVRKLC